MNEPTEGCTISTTKLLTAPVELVWEVWTNPRHVENWWGPSGFTTSIHHMDFTEGGEWKLTIQGPDGTSYPNRSIFKQLIPLHKIVFEHFNPHFFTTVLFEAQGNETLLTWVLLFDSMEMRNIIGKAHKAEEGQKQNIKKLEIYISKLKVDKST